MRIPGYRLHLLNGKAKGRWSIWVNGNWRLTFEFDGGDVHVLDYEDYH
jgi:proteic killer suppression protein